MSRRFQNLILLLAIAGGMGKSAFASALGSVTITGGEQSSGGVWDTGTVTVTINGQSKTIVYGRNSTPSAVASGLGATISQTCGFPIYAHAVGAVLTFYTKGTSTVTSISFSSATKSPSLFASPSFSINGTVGVVSIPTISLSVSTGAPGSSLTIFAGSGTNFGATQGSGTVLLGGTIMNPTNWGESTISITVPSTFIAGIYPVSVTADNLPSLSVPFTVLPHVTNLSFDSVDSPIPAANLTTALSGPPQVGFVIVGAGFGANDIADDTYVTWNGLELNTTLWSDTKIVVQVPAGFAPGGPYTPVVTVGGIASNGGATFQVVPALGCSN